MLKLGEKIISDIYLGDKKIAKVFWGDKLVYQAGQPIFLEYIEATGTQWIDTGIIPTINAKARVKFSPVQKNSFGFFGARRDPWRFNCTTFSSGEYFAFSMSNNTWSDNRTKVVVGEVYDCTAYNGTQIINGVEYTEPTVTELNAACGTFRLAALNSDGKLVEETGWYNINKVKWYACQLWDNDVLIQDLRPCIHPNGTVCMYDMVTKKYFYNQGTGELTAGNKINFVDYIHTDGNSYIDTGIALGINHKVSVKTKVPTSSSTAIQLFGNYSDSAGYFTCNVANSIGAISRFDGATYTGNISRSDGNFHTYTLDKNGILIDSDDILKWAGTPKDFQQSDSFYLFRARGSSSVAPNGTQISEEEVWENDTLVQHLKPCVVAGQAGLYDMVTGKIFTNAGTGTLKASGRFVESIVFDGASWIDTGIKPNPATTRVVFENMFLDNSKIQAVCGSRSVAICGPYSCNFFYNLVVGDYTPEVLRLDWTAQTLEAHVPINQKNIIECYGNSVTINGTKYQSTISKANTYIAYSMYLGNHNNIGQTYQDSCNMRVYSWVVYDNGKLVQDLRPYVDENGTACFKDIVTGKLFYNQGTGKLTYTE